HAPAERLPSRPGSLRGGALACLVAPGHPAVAVGRGAVYGVSGFTDHGRGALHALPLTAHFARAAARRGSAESWRTSAPGPCSSVRNRLDCGLPGTRQVADLGRRALRPRVARTHLGRTQHRAEL